MDGSIWNYLMQEVQGKYCIPSRLLYSLTLTTAIPLSSIGGAYERWNLQFKQIYQKIANKTSLFLFYLATKIRWNLLHCLSHLHSGGLSEDLGGRAGPILGVSSPPPPHPRRAAVAWLNLYKIISIQSRRTYRGGVMHIYLDAPDLCVHPLIYCNLAAHGAPPPPRYERRIWSGYYQKHSSRFLFSYFSCNIWRELGGRIKNVPVSQNRWSLRGFIRAISFKRIKSGLLTEEFWQRLRYIFICCTQRHIIKHAKTNTVHAGKYLHHLWVTSAFAMTVKWPPLFPFLSPAFNLVVWRLPPPVPSSFSFPLRDCCCVLWLFIPTWW